MQQKQRSGLFDVSYGLASAGITGTGNTIVSSTEADYYGLKVIAGTSQMTIKVYDNASTALGNILDVAKIAPGGNLYDDRFNPVKAKNGIVINVTGTGGTGVAFYGPKG